MTTTVVRNYRRSAPEALHDVRENARKLSILYTVEVELARLVGSWIARTPELPEKLTLARVLYEDADHARLLGQRLLELRVPESRLETLRRRTAPMFQKLERAGDPAAFLSALFGVVKPRLVADYRRHLDAAPPYVDEPSVRWIGQILGEEQDHLAAGLALLAERRTATPEAAGAGLWDLDHEDGGLVEGDYLGREPARPDSPVWPAAVTKLAGEQPMPAYPEEFEAAMRRCVHDLVFSETEALDIFGRYVYEFAELPWQFSVEAARVAWDEARHVELLLNVLDRYGGRVGEFPAKAPGYEEYVRQPSKLEQLIMVNVIAEGEISTDTQTQHREAFRQLGDELSALLKDYEMADEVSHGQFGLRWARWLADHTGEDYEAALARARRSLEEFKSSHDAQGGDSPIPLVRLGVDETGPDRVVNVSAKRLVGFSEDEIAAIATDASKTMEDARI
jgi:uncharacterized ferritin-like protein (DUF455 family)